MIYPRSTFPRVIKPASEIDEDTIESVEIDIMSMVRVAIAACTVDSKIIRFHTQEACLLPVDYITIRKDYRETTAKNSS